MELWLRYKNATDFEDLKTSISSKEEWYDKIYDPNLVSSVLWPTNDLFHLDIKYNKRKHAHEIDYQNNHDINRSFLLACKNIAKQLESKYAGANCLIYAPLRGALPIWNCIKQFIYNINYYVYFPVTSSFIFYPQEFNIHGKKSKPASGRYNNRFELNRISPLLSSFDYILYIDEIISGAMMHGHIKDMLRLSIHQKIPIIVAGLADNYGKRSELNRKLIANFVEERKVEYFIWEGCESLITEDQKFLLGVHYVDYKLGPHVVPLLNENLMFFNEKVDFDKDILHI